MHPSSSAFVSDLLSGMRLFGVQFHRMEFHGSQGIGFSNEVGRAQFHFVGRGPLWLRSPGGHLHRLDTGDAVLIPHGGPHAVLASEDTRATDVKPFTLDAFAGSECSETPLVDQGRKKHAPVMFSCCMTLELGGMQPLVTAMPEVLQVTTLLESSPEIRPMLDAMERESLGLEAGHMGILARLAEVVAALIVRGWVAGGCGGASGWLSALQDPRLSMALVMMHRYPGRNWTVAMLANEAGQSRSVFAKRFFLAAGVTPLRYLTDLRMRLAVLRLSRERQSVEAVASELGYGSLAAFSRAFKRSVGMSPGTVRVRSAKPD